MSPQYDFIVVGGGSSGCVTAGRLVKDHGARVLLLEAGPSDRNPLVNMPAGFIKLLGVEKFMWFYETERQERLGNRAPIIPQGRIVGGGSSVNAMIYIRGQASDYDPWEESSGGAGWAFRNVVAHMRRMEGNQRLHNALHGVSGPLKISDPIHTCEASRAFVRAAQAVGIPYSGDFNGPRQTGVGYYQTTTFQGRRCSAATAFLGPVRDDPKLKLETRVVVTRIMLEGSRAVGVEYLQNGRTVQARAAQEVILCAGAIATPKLMMLSGIGPEDELRRHDITVKHRLDGVGGNFQDHHEVPVIAMTNGAYGYHGQDVGIAKYRNGLQYLLFKSGPVASNGVEAGGFFNPEDMDADPTIQLFCVPAVFLDKDIKDIQPDHGITVNSCLLRPKSRGRLTLRSADPKAAPVIDPNYFDHPDDLRITLASVKVVREMFEASPLKEMVKKVVFPSDELKTDDDLIGHCRRFVKTVYHPVGTTRMGLPSDPLAVVDPDLRVIGMEGLRVFDASMMPTIISGNTNTTVLAVADKGVAHMMKEQLPAPIDLPNHPMAA
ncbi:MAG TPA: GMC family oxidoreductase N-terminal domain-containing protein [Geminicoccus sp.]|uniref:GMC family oxidoreductase n=1 Tax=Geminicoccus sp. TaxID=2024832 RepID=UPI002E2EBC67|nr:GMC family oxidoreductase N-terminal domain-containing protein [Geminicoccus sp.]HEX2529665.1 GMC family oxidoreductase N-terminal domain-containing protein [Geminicoccus sp.]